MRTQNNFDTIVCMGESKGGQIYKFCLDFHHFSKRHSGVYVEFSLLEMWWFDDFFFDLIGTHVFLFFVFSFTQQSSNQLCFCFILFFFIEQTFLFSFCNHYNIPQVEVFFRVSFCSLINYKLYGNYSYV